MKQLLIKFAGLAILFVILLLGSARVENADAASNIAWWSDRVDGGADNRGIKPVIALNPTTGIPYVSYYDTTNANLYLAHFVGDAADGLHHPSFLFEWNPAAQDEILGYFSRKNMIFGGGRLRG